MLDSTIKKGFLRGTLVIGVLIALIALANMMGKDTDTEANSEDDEMGVLAPFEGECSEERVVEGRIVEGRIVEEQISDNLRREDAGSDGSDGSDGDEDSPEIGDIQSVVAGEDRIDERPEGLGPTAWMAPAEDVDEEALRERLERGQLEQEFELALREDRRTSTGIADSVVQECHRELLQRQPEASGRVAVQWRMQTEAGQGHIEAPEMLLNVGLEDPQFTGCILDNLSDVPFEAIGDDGDLSVRWVVNLQ